MFHGWSLRGFLVGVTH